MQSKRVIYLFLIIVALCLFIPAAASACLDLNVETFPYDVNVSTAICTGTYVVNISDWTPVFNITASGATLDGNGSTIIGNTSGDGVYAKDVSDIVIDNLTISGYLDGIFWWGVSNSNITNCNTSSGEYANMMGIYLDSSNDNIILDSISSFNLITGIYLYVSDGNTLTNNIANSNTVNGIVLEWGSDNNVFVNNTANSNAVGMNGAGFYINDVSNNNTFTNSTANLNDYGFYIFQNSDNNTITGGEMTLNIKHGVYLYGGNDYNVINDSNMSFNTEHGIHLLNETIYGSCTYNNITNNFVHDNTFMGIYLLDAGSPGHTENLIQNNTVYANLEGITLVTSDVNDILDNNVSYNINYNIYAQNSWVTNLTSNTANNGTGMGSTGIYLDSSSSCTLADNVANSNSYGIYLISSALNTLSSNTANSNSIFGFFLSMSTNTTMTNDASSGNIEWDIYSTGSDTGTVITNLTINGNITSFTHGGGVSMKQTASPANDPSGWTNISRYLNITNTTVNTWAQVNVSYTDAAVTAAGITDENTLTFMHYNTTPAWEAIGSVVDTTNNYVSSNITTFNVTGSDFGLFGDTDNGPTYANTGVNSTLHNHQVKFYVNWTDDYGLSGYIFSTNNTGTWTNDSFVDMTGTNNWSNVTSHTLNSTSGITVSWRVYANDSDNQWNNTGMINLTTTNTAPTVASATISPTLPTQLQDLTCVNGSVADADGDTVTLIYNWYKNNVAQGINSQILEFGNTTAGEDWNCSITPNDGYDNGAEVISDAETILSDNPPTYSNTGTDTTLHGQSVKFYVNWTDETGLSGHIFSTNNTGTWTNDSFVDMTGTNNWSNVTSHTLNSTNGITISWILYANDSANQWNNTGMINLTTTNTAPTVASATISPTAPTDAQDLTCGNGSVLDAESDTVTLLYAWYKSNVIQSTTTQTLGSGSTTASESWKCTITPNDGYDNGTTVNSSAVTITASTTAGGSSSNLDGGSPSLSITFGEQVVLRQSQRATLAVGDDAHTLTLVKLTDSEATVKIASTPTEFTLVVGESKDVNVTGDGINDIVVVLDKIEDLKAYLTVTLAALPPEKDETEVGWKEGVKEELWVWKYWIIASIALIVVGTFIWVVRAQRRK